MKNVNKMYLFLVLSLFFINFNCSFFNNLKNKVFNFFVENGKNLKSYNFRDNKVKVGLYLFGSIAAMLEANALFSNIDETEIGKKRYCPNSFKKFGIKKATGYFVAVNNAFGRFFRDGFKSAVYNNLIDNKFTKLIKQSIDAGVVDNDGKMSISITGKVSDNNLNFQNLIK